MGGETFLDTNKKGRAIKPCQCENRWKTMILAEELATQRLQTEQRAAQESRRQAAVRNGRIGNHHAMISINTRGIRQESALIRPRTTP
jgi:hypothetical protein